MEYVGGTRLDNFIGAPPSAASMPDRFKLAFDVCSALRYLHSQRPCIVHGDIKCSNILVEQTASGVNAKLVDFGLSRLITRRARPLGGTTHWMAPEAMLETGCMPAPSADVFSFGRLLFAITTGRKPLGNMNAQAIRSAYREGRTLDMSWPDSLPFVRECQQICDACTRINPAERLSMIKVHERLEVCVNLPSEANIPADLGNAVARARATKGKRAERSSSASAESDSRPEQRPGAESQESSIADRSSGHAPNGAMVSTVERSARWLMRI